ncbi:MAG: acetyl-CoA carboxylase biotin carboxyl carrier protein, partial [Pseudonocardiaceae bacterium]
VEWPAAPSAPVPGAPVPGAAPEVAPDGAEPEPRLQHVCAPMVGTYYHASQPGAEPFVKPGDQVALGQQIGILEVMKLMVPVETDLAGRVVAVLTENGQPVEYGQVLISVEPE